MMLKCWMQHNDWCALPCCGNFSLTASLLKVYWTMSSSRRDRERVRVRANEWIKHNESACKWMPCTAVPSHAQSIFYSNEGTSWLISVETLWKFVVINHDFCYCHRLIHALIHTLTHTHIHPSTGINWTMDGIVFPLTICFRSLANTPEEAKKVGKLHKVYTTYNTPINNCAHRPC